MKVKHKILIKGRLLLLKNVIWALFIKEIKIKFSNKGYLTYFWILGEPLLQIIFFLILFRVVFGRTDVMNLPIPLVLITGILPYFFYFKTVMQSFNAVNANQALLVYIQISIFSTILARLFVELVLFLVAFITIYSLFWYLGVGYKIYNIIILFLSMFFLILFTLGVSLAFATLGFFFEELQVLIGFVIRFGYFLSGVIYSISIIPYPYNKYLLYNPILQSITIFRNTFLRYELPADPNISLCYLAMSSTATFFIGLAVYFVARREFIKEARARA